MTLREELEILRGEPIQVFTGDPMDIPCVETSDSERLCKHPVVSVSMITYNHEPYIRQAIEGVMMQKTDFEFELVIGEDCSTDSTREICFEYQKRYPDKIRVLWCDHNLYRNPHPAGGNSRRNMAHCRGEFIALCEGDDYWIDPLKLQKQVDVMRKYPNVGFCFCGSKVFDQGSGDISRWYTDAYCGGVIPGEKFAHYTIFGKNPQLGCGDEGFVMTATVLFRKSCYGLLRERFDLLNWRLALGDLQLRAGMGLVSDVYYLLDDVSVYRRTSTGAMSTNSVNIFRDASIVRLYYAINGLGYGAGDLPYGLRGRTIRSIATWMSARAKREKILYGARVLLHWTILRIYGLSFLPQVFCYFTRSAGRVVDLWARFLYSYKRCKRIQETYQAWR